MAEIEKSIMDHLQSEPLVNAAKIGVEVKRGKGLFNRRRVVHVFGAVDSEIAHQQVVKIVQKQVGDRYDFSDELKTKVRQ